MPDRSIARHGISSSSRLSSKTESEPFVLTDCFEIWVETLRPSAWVDGLFVVYSMRPVCRVRNENSKAKIHFAKFILRTTLGDHAMIPQRSASFMCHAQKESRKIIFSKYEDSIDLFFFVFFFVFYYYFVFAVLCVEDWFAY